MPAHILTGTPGSGKTALQLRRAPAAGFVDRSPVCTLALARFLGFTPSVPLTTAAADAVVAYSQTVFFVRHRSWTSSGSTRRPTASSAPPWSTCRTGHWSSGSP